MSRDYAELIERLTKLQPSGVDDDDDGVLRFDNARAGHTRRAGGQASRLMQAIETINGKLAAHIGKYDGLFGRLCVAFHCIEHADDNHIPEFVTEDTANARRQVHAPVSAAACLRVLQRRAGAGGRP